MVVILDEIGLAEKSESNPLKVLHRLLEPPEVAMIGLSNWSLDAAKMNRAVHASRPPLTAYDLQETALTMRKGLKSSVDEAMLQSLSQDFYAYLKELSEGGRYFFHGTRDFYNLISFICRKWEIDGVDDLDPDILNAIVVRGLQRNFGGANDDLTFKKFMNSIGKKEEYEQRLVDPVTLIR